MFERFKSLKNLFKPTVKFVDNFKTVEVNAKEEGASGTQNFSGYFEEEYLTELQGMEGAETYDKIRRGDDQVAMVLTSVKNTIVGAKWNWEPVDDTPDEEKKAEFLKHVFFNDLDKCWQTKLRESLSCIEFGFAIFEVIHKLVKGHKDFGDYIGIKKLGFRIQKSIERWNFVDKELDNVEQQIFGDLESTAKLPVKNLMITTIEQEGDNYEGISMLRASYGSWFRKNQYLKYQAAGIEKSALGILIGRYPEGQYDTSEYTNLKNALINMSSHKKNFLMLPNAPEGRPGWGVDKLDVPFEADNVNVAIEREDQAIVRRFLAQFLLLGSQSSSGSWALSNDQSDFFLNGLIYIADLVTKSFQKQGEKLIKINFGPSESYPRLTHAGIKDKAGKELAEIIKMFTDGKIIIPDDKLEDHLRDRLSLPEREEFEEGEENPRTKTPQLPFNNQTPAEEIEEETDKVDDDKKDIEEENENKKQSEIKLKSARSQIDKAGKELEELFVKHLTFIRDDFIKQVMNDFSKSSEAQKFKAFKNARIRGNKLYEKELKGLLESQALESESQAFKEMNLDEAWTKAVQLVKKGKDKKLNKRTKLFKDVLASTVVSAQTEDIKNAVAFQFGSSYHEGIGAAVLESDLKDSTEKVIDRGKNGAATVGSQIVNKSRENFFFDDEMKKEIESFTFVNDDPQSDICKYLCSPPKTFSVDDARALEYSPPLHYNCNTIISPNFRGVKNNPEPQKITPSATAKKSKNLKEN